MKDFAQKGENSRSQFEGEVIGEKRLIDETREVIDCQRRLECLNGQQAGNGVGQKIVDGRHRSGDAAGEL